MQQRNLYRVGFLVSTTLLVGLLLVGFSLTEKTEAQTAEPAGMEPFIGEITLFAGNFAPRGWAFCDGQLLSINSNQALFSILGTTYGGDGRTTFALPDLRGRVPIHAGQGIGLSNRPLGSTGGMEQLPAKTLSLGKASTERRTAPADPDVGRAGTRNPAPAVATPQTTEVADPSVDSGNMQPYATVHYIIALQGVFPSRS